MLHTDKTNRKLGTSQLLRKENNYCNYLNTKLISEVTKNEPFV